MSWLEIISLRSVDGGRKALEVMGLRKEEMKRLTYGLEDFRIYFRVGLDTDVSLHLRWRTRKPVRTGSDLGNLLARSLREFGLIEQTIWIEEDEK